MNKKWTMPLWITAIVATAGLLWISQTSISHQDTKETLTVSAASSLKDALTDVKQLYNKRYPDRIITLNFGGTGALVHQIEQGAEVDVFISASVKMMDLLTDKNLMETRTLRNLYSNRLVLIAPKSSSLEVGDFEDVIVKASVEKIALGEPKSVPAGQYAKEVFTTLDLISHVKEKAVYGKDVREVLTWVESGNASLGVVYESDAKTSEQVNIMAIAPSETHSPIVYPGAVVKASKVKDAAEAFLIFLQSEEAQKVFQDYGFYSL